MHGEDVDVVISKRSTGSLLKPYLYSFMINDGELLPNMLIPDIPTQIAGYVPQNFNYTYDGAVPAKQALSRSLNIPAVKMLQNYTVPRLLKRLNQMGLNTINRSADDYGLSLILGSSESTLWDMCSVYSSMARVLNRYSKTNVYNEADWKKPHYLKEAKDRSVSYINTQLPSLLSASAIYLTFDAMAEVNRPDIDASWQRLGNAHKIAWKTGTSFGFRDGWAIGVSANYVVGVWVGNADGEGRPGLTGISSAAPILFEIFPTDFKSASSNRKLVNTAAGASMVADSTAAFIEALASDLALRTPPTAIEARSSSPALPASIPVVSSSAAGQAAR